MKLLLAFVFVAAAASVARADSFTPVTLSIHIAPVARLHKQLRVTVGVAADPSVLDTRSAPLRIEVRLASECGASFQTTRGAPLLNKRLRPQPALDQAYAVRAHGAGRPGAYGVKAVCVYLEEEGDNRVFASDQSVEVDVSKRCTVAAAVYDRHRTRARRRAARRACGPGVPL